MYISYEVYLLDKDAKAPDDGVLMETGQSTRKYGGFYLENLKNPLIVQEGQSYSVIITQQREDGKYAVNAPFYFGENSAFVNDESPIYAKAVINEGESYIFSNNRLGIR